MTTNDASRPPRARWPLALGLLCLALTAWLAWRALSLGMADRHADTEPARALAWRSDHPLALLRQAERLANDPAQAEAAADHARRALRANPLDGRPYRVLAQLAAAAGQQGRAAELFGLAAARSPRDLASQAWLLDHHLAAGDPVAAMPHLDLLLRVQPGLFGRIEPLLLALAATPQAQDALADRLATAPPWRASLLVLASQKAEDPAAIAPLFERLRKAPGGLAAPELEAWLDRLGRENQWGQAYLTWVSQLPPERLQGLGNLYNGGFEWEPGQGGFDWRIGRIPGARVDRLPTDGAGGRLALRVAFEDRRVPFNHVRQQLALAPGRYRLMGRAKADNLRSERGLVWTLSCAGSGKALGETPPLRGSGPWRGFQAEFDVPADNCGGQWLMLHLPARIPAEQRIGGQAWFDDLKITRLQPPP